MNVINFPVDHFINPPSDRDSWDEYEKQIPPQHIYMSLGVNPDFFKISRRYCLYSDRKRTQIVQELSSEINDSRSAKNV